MKAAVPREGLDVGRPSDSSLGSALTEGHFPAAHGRLRVRETGLAARGWQFRGREARHVAVVMEPRRLPASTDNVEA